MSGLPWFARDLTAMVRPIMPGRVHGVLASTGTGKTLFDLNVVAHLLDHEPNVRIIVAATEETERYHDLLACRAAAVSYTQWLYGELEAQAVQEVDRWRAFYQRHKGLYLLPQRNPSLQDIVAAIQVHGRLHLLVVDHVHELDDQGERLPEFLKRVMGVLADAAVRLEMAVIAFFQVHRPPGRQDRLYAYRVPVQAAGMGSSKIEQRVDVLLGLSRKLRDDTPADVLARFSRGLLRRGESERDHEEPNVARVTCLKHRMDDDARNRSVLLTVHRGRIRDRIAVVGDDVMMPPPGVGDAWEP